MSTESQSEGNSEFFDCLDQVTSVPDIYNGNDKKEDLEPDQFSNDFYDAEASTSHQENTCPDVDDLLNKIEDRQTLQIDEIGLAETEKGLTEEEKLDRKSRALELKQKGNDCFGGGDFESAIGNYTEALMLLPTTFKSERAVLYGNRAACLMKSDDVDGAIADCSSALELDSSYAKAIQRRAWCYEQKEDSWDKALKDYETLLALQPRNARAKQAVQELPSKIAERNERMKTEMFDKLKDLGNMVLRPFGLSTDNFKLEPNANGGYSVNLQR